MSVFFDLDVVVRAANAMEVSLPEAEAHLGALIAAISDEEGE